MAKKYYAIASGRKVGVVDSWELCKTYVHGYQNSIYKSFDTYDKAKKYIETYENKSLEKTTDIENIDKNIQDLEDGHLIAFVDGSYNDKYEIYSSGGIIFTKDEKHTFKKAYDDEYTSMRNVAGELKSVMYVLSYAFNKNIQMIDIYYDYLGIENWAANLWKANNPLTQGYKDYFKKISQSIKVNFHKVKSHSNIKYNDIADELAKKAIQQQIEKRRA